MPTLVIYGGIGLIIVGVGICIYMRFANRRFWISPPPEIEMVEKGDLAREAQVLRTVPQDGPTRGAERYPVGITTTDFDGPITKVHIGGQECELNSEKARTSTECEVFLPVGARSGPVDIQVWAGERTAKLAKGFNYFEPTIFERVGKNIQLSPDGLTASRPHGVDSAICVGSTLDPVGEDKDISYYEIFVQEMAGTGDTHATNVKALAVGFTTQPAFEAADVDLLQEVDGLSDVWMCGYEQRGALAFTRARGTSSSVPLVGWRPARDVHGTMIIGVMACQGHAGARELRVVIGGAVKCSMPMDGMSPLAALRPVVDLRGRAVKVSLIQNPRAAEADLRRASRPP